VDIDAVRAAFDAQIRRKPEPDEPGAFVEADDGVLRWVAPGTATSCIIWSALTDGTADAAIAAQKAYFAGRGTPVEWKYYDYDQPSDLPDRLVAAGFEPEDEEVMLVAETSSIDSAVVLPDGVRLVPVTDESGLAALMRVHDLAFAEHATAEYEDRLRAQLGSEQVQMVVAMAGDEPVSAARVEFVPGTDFAGLWGGGTVPAWRQKGIFKALVAYRADLAAARGYRYLQVDALPTSRPILLRLGFQPVASTTPYVFTPEARAGG
jgi:GNAT superfamily N-acetyltransferase